MVSIKETLQQLVTGKQEAQKAEQNISAYQKSLPQLETQQVLRQRATQAPLQAQVQRGVVQIAKGKAQQAQQEVEQYKQDVAQYEKDFQTYLQSDSGKIQYAKEEGIKGTPVYGKLGRGYVTQVMAYKYNTPYGPVTDWTPKYEAQQRELKYEAKEHGFSNVNEYIQMSQWASKQTEKSRMASWQPFQTRVAELQAQLPSGEKLVTSNGKITGVESAYFGQSLSPEAYDTRVAELNKAVNPQVFNQPATQFSAGGLQSVQAFTKVTPTPFVASIQPAPQRNMFQQAQQYIAEGFKEKFRTTPTEIGRNAWTSLVEYPTALENMARIAGEKVSSGTTSTINRYAPNLNAPMNITSIPRVIPGTMTYEFNPVTKQIESRVFTKPEVIGTTSRNIQISSLTGGLTKGTVELAPWFIPGASAVMATTYGARGIDRLKSGELLAGASDLVMAGIPVVGKIVKEVRLSIPQYGLTAEGRAYGGLSKREYERFLQAENLAKTNRIVQEKATRELINKETKLLSSLESREAFRKALAKELGLEYKNVPSAFEGVIKYPKTNFKGTGDISGFQAGAEPIGIPPGSQMYKDAMEQIAKDGLGPKGVGERAGFVLDVESKALRSAKLPFVSAPSQEARISLMQGVEIARRQPISIMKGSLGDLGTKKVGGKLKYSPDLNDPFRFNVYTIEKYSQIAGKSTPKITGYITQLVKPMDGGPLSTSFFSASGKGRDVLLRELKARMKRTKVPVPSEVNVGSPIKVEKIVTRVGDLQAGKVNNPVEKILLQTEEGLVKERMYQSRMGTPFLPKEKGRIVDSMKDLFRFGKAEKQAVRRATQETQSTTKELIVYGPTEEALQIEGVIADKKVLGIVNRETRQPYKLTGKTKTRFLEAGENKFGAIDEGNIVPKSKKTPWSVTHPEPQAPTPKEVKVVPETKVPERSQILEQPIPKEKAVVEVKTESRFAGGVGVTGVPDLVPIYEFDVGFGKSLLKIPRISTATPREVLSSLKQSKVGLSLARGEISKVGLQAELIKPLSMTQLKEGLMIKPMVLESTIIKEQVMLKPLVMEKTMLKQGVMVKQELQQKSQQREMIKSLEQVQLKEQVQVRQSTRTEIRPKIEVRVRPEPRPRPPKKEFQFRLPSASYKVKKKSFGKITPSGEKFIAITKRYGKEQVLGVGKTVQEAEMIAKKSALGTLGATVKVKTSSGRQVKLAPDKLFRQSKTDPLAIVQTQRARLASRGERVEIKQSRRRFRI